MTKLEKSIRSAMKDYRNDIKSGKLVSLGSVGMMPVNYKHFRNAFASVQDGICEDIRIYGYQDAYERRDYESWEESIDITEAIDGAVREYPAECTWDEVIVDIMEIIEQSQKED